MSDGRPTVLIASVSRDAARGLELALEPLGCNLLRVEDAEDARRKLNGHARAGAILVIDSGLLRMPHDSQWRDFRSEHRALETVVRCFAPRSGPVEDTAGRMQEVDPDDTVGLCQTVRRFRAPSGPAG